MRPKRAVTRDTLADTVLPLVPGRSRRTARHLVCEVFEVAADILDEHGRLTLPEFGRFEVLTKRERPGRNPRTKAPATISARRSLSFYAAPKLLEAVSATPAIPRRVLRPVRLADAPANP